MNIAIQEGQMKICFRIGEDGLIELVDFFGGKKQQRIASDRWTVDCISGVTSAACSTGDRRNSDGNACVQT